MSRTIPVVSHAASKLPQSMSAVYAQCIASTLGSLISLIVAGSMLVEKVFDIQGFGMLSYQALMDKDYALIMGTLLLTSFLMVLGNLLSDIIVAAVDPRIKFE